MSSDFFLVDVLRCTLLIVCWLFLKLFWCILMLWILFIAIGCAIAVRQFLIFSTVLEKLVVEKIAPKQQNANIGQVINKKRNTEYKYNKKTDTDDAEKTSSSEMSLKLPHNFLVLLNGINSDKNWRQYNLQNDLSFSPLPSSGILVSLNYRQKWCQTFALDKGRRKNGILDSCRKGA